MLESLNIQEIRANFVNKYNFNSNLLEGTKYIFVSHSLPNLNFFANGITLPSVSVGEARQSTPYADVFRAGDKMEYEPLQATFLIDEDFRVWEELYNWIRGYSYPHSGTEYKNQQKKGIYQDFSVLILKNSYESNLSFRFHDSFPTYLGPVEMTTTKNADDVLQAEVLFRYDTFEIVRGAQ